MTIFTNKPYFLALFIFKKLQFITVEQDFVKIEEKVDPKN